jgi:prepilin-type N-terminal cleavage/methylation domain-containing protein
MHSRSHVGFTLIELSIVLVIIGLIVGGVMVGKDLIKSAEIRKSINSLEQVNTAVNTFKMKYGCVPGDCTNTTSLFSGISAGNGNGYIDNWSLESLAAVDSLRAANLLSDALVEITSGTPLYNGSHYIRGHNNSWSYLYYADLYSVGGGAVTPSVPAVLSSAQLFGTTITWTNWINVTGCFNGEAVSANDASRIDQKLDDAIPQTGKFIAFDAKDVNGTCSGYPGRCWNTGQNSYKNSEYAGCRIIYYLQ